MLISMFVSQFFFAKLAYESLKLYPTYKLHPSFPSQLSCILEINILLLICPTLPICQSLPLLVRTRVKDTVPYYCLYSLWGESMSKSKQEQGRWPALCLKLPSRQIFGKHCLASGQTHTLCLHEHISVQEPSFLYL